MDGPIGSTNKFYWNKYKCMDQWGPRINFIDIYTFFAFSLSFDDLGVCKYSDFSWF